jgi:ribokinase
MVTRVELTPSIGETVSGIGLEIIPGGKGANQAVAMSKLGANVKMVGLIGDDDYGKLLLTNLEKEGVDYTDVAVVSNCPSGMAFIMVNRSGNNSIVVIAGANDKLIPEKIKKSWFDDVEYVVCQLETPLKTTEAVLKEAKLNKIKTILNPAPAQKLSENILKYVDVLVPNETEFHLMTNIRINSKEDFLEGYYILNQLGIKELIVTLGDKGAWYFNGIDYLEIKAKEVEAVDTTAAGDSFIAGVITKLSLGYDIGEALVYGAKVAAITVTRFGAQSSLPTVKEVETFEIDDDFCFDMINCKF